MKDADLPLGIASAPRPDRREQLWRARPLDRTKGDIEQHQDPNLPQTRTARAPPRATLLTSSSINSIPSGQHLPHTFRAENKPHIQGPRPATHHHPQTQGTFVPWHPLPAINSIAGVYTQLRDQRTLTSLHRGTRVALALKPQEAFQELIPRGCQGGQPSGWRMVTPGPPSLTSFIPLKM